MAAVSGSLRIGEASATARAIGARQRGPSAAYSAIAIGLMIVGAICGGLFSSYVLHDEFAGIAIGWAAGAAAYLLIARPLTVARFRSRMAKKGFSEFLPLELEVAPDALHYRLGEIRQSASWSAVSEVFENRGYWIFLAQSAPFFAPKRFFESPAAEKAFLAAALAHMSPDARARSRKAAAYAGVAA